MDYLAQVSIPTPNPSPAVSDPPSAGKTYTVFGPDAVDAPEAWFKHKEPHKLWGIFPRLAYDIFKEKQVCCVFICCWAWVYLVPQPSERRVGVPGRLESPAEAYHLLLISSEAPRHP